jgi:TetR/AcrR family transcriptional regulator
MMRSNPLPAAALAKVRESPSSTKARILAAAQSVFAARGFKGASTREIAATAGVNISSLHYHWESKETLYFAVFADVYDRIVTLLESAIAGPPRADGRNLVDESVGALFDFFAVNPELAKLLARRLLDAEEADAQIEQQILVPAWRRFAQWTYQHSGIAADQQSMSIFMLTLYAVLLQFMLDSQQFAVLLGGSIRDPEVRARVRAHLVGLVHTLLREEKSRRRG